MSTNLAGTIRTALQTALGKIPGIQVAPSASLREQILAVAGHGSPEVVAELMQTIAGGSNEGIVTRGRAVLAPCYPTAKPYAPTFGDGCYVWDSNGTRLLDFYAGVAVNSLGHGHAALLETIRAHADLLIHTSNGCYNPATVRLAEYLVSQTMGVGAAKVFFCNSGAEANEAAIRLARFYGVSKGRRENDIVCMEGSFHGRTLATAAATGQPAMREKLDPLPGGFVHVPFNDAEAVRNALTDRTTAVLVEPVLCEGGFIFPSPGYLQALRTICTEREILLMVDEVQTGIGRTGALFAYQLEDIVPDVVTMAKGIAGGLPVGAMMARLPYVDLLISHGCTFGGNPLAAAGALTVLETVNNPEFLGRVTEVGDYLLTGLERLRQKHSGIVSNVRGKGLLVALDLDKQRLPNQKAVDGARARGLVVGPLKDKGMRISPPLILSKDQVDEGLEILDRVFREEAMG